MARVLARADWTVDPPVIGLWVAIQIGCLALAFLHVPLAASYPPGERLAVELLSAAQIGSAALLAPALARSAGTTAVAAASTWPALLLAGALQVQPVPCVLLAAAVLTAWIVGLALWTSLVASPAAKRTVAAVGSLIGIGGGLLTYLAVEFGSSAGVGGAVSEGSSIAAQGGDGSGTWSRLLDMAPTDLVWRAAESGRVDAASAAPLMVVLIVGATLTLRRTLRRARDPLPPTTRPLANAPSLKYEVR